MVTRDSDEAVPAGCSAFAAALKSEMDALWHEAVRQEARAAAMQRWGVWCPTEEQVAAELDGARRRLELEAWLGVGELDGVGGALWPKP